MHHRLMEREMKTAVFAVALLALPMCGCVTGGPHSPQVAAIDDTECQSYGAKPGSAEYIQCRVTKKQQHELAMAAVISGGEGNTSCTRFGNTTSCF
jgi:hypothetical protein